MSTTAMKPVRLGGQTVALPTLSAPVGAPQPPARYPVMNAIADAALVDAQLKAIAELQSNPPAGSLAALCNAGLGHPLALARAPELAKTPEIAYVLMALGIAHGPRFRRRAHAAELLLRRLHRVCGRAGHGEQARSACGDRPGRSTFRSGSDGLQAMRRRRSPVRPMAWALALATGWVTAATAAPPEADPAHGRLPGGADGRSLRPEPRRL